jgi:cytoskeletal protein CcmA (bactofilin family)
MVTLGPNDRLTGHLSIEGDLRLNGTVEGEVQATGDVEIADMANVTASVAGREVSVRGKVTGPVTASKKLVVARSGSLMGDVRVPRLVVQDGATFSGNVSMGGTEVAAPAASPAPAPPAPAPSPPPAAPRPAATAPTAPPKPKRR